MKVIDIDGLKFLVEGIYAEVEKNIDTKITTVIGEESTNDNIPGALAVYEHIKTALENISGTHLKPVEELPATGADNIIYLLKDENESAYGMFLYYNSEWARLGAIEVDLSGYVKKEDLKALSNEDIQAVFDEINNGV